MQPLLSFLSQENRELFETWKRRMADPSIELPERARMRVMDIESALERWAKICPPLYLETDPARLAAPSADAIRFAFPADGFGVMFTGPTGTGKTRTAWLLAGRRYCSGRSFSFQAYTGPSLAVAIAGAYNDGSIERLVSRLDSVDVLLLDDMFKTNWTPAQESIVFDALEQRAAWKKFTIVTMNCDGKALARILSDDVRDPFLRRLSPPFFKPFLFRHKPKEA